VTTLTSKTRRFADGVLQSNENDNQRSDLIMKNSQQKEWKGSPEILAILITTGSMIKPTNVSH
jgi:hypothetical protein